MGNARPPFVTVLIASICGLPTISLAKEKEKAEVTVNYVLAPPRPLPDGLKAIAVIDSGVQTEGNKEDQRERKWSQMAADMLESMLANSSTRFGSGLQVAQRRMTKQILQEKDLQLAGLVDGPTAERAGKLLAVQGLVASRITINIDTQRTRKSTIDWGSVMGAAVQGAVSGHHRSAPIVVHQPAYVVQRTAPAVVYDARSRDPRLLRYRRYGYDPRYRETVVVAPGTTVIEESPPPPPPVNFGTREVEEISRQLTVQCSFSLIDAVTGQSLVQFSPPPYRKVDKSSPDFLFGSIHQAELDPVDHFIGELVEQAVQEFVSLLVPTEVEYHYELMGKHSRGEAGVRAMRADDYDTAYEQFSSEAQGGKDADEAVFAMGVINELRGKRQEALTYYRQAASMDVKGDELQMYLAAKKRLTDHLPRIMKNPPAGAVPPGTAADSTNAPITSPPGAVNGSATEGSPVPRADAPASTDGASDDSVQGGQRQKRHRSR